MARYLQQLLNAREPMFSAAMRQLESMTRNQGIDVAYIGDITARAHDVMRQIGLSPADTTEQELYHALEAQADNGALFSRTDDVGLSFGGRVISFNHDDVKENVSRPYESRTVARMRCQIQHGLTARYVAADGDDEALIDEVVGEAGLDRCDLDEYHEKKQMDSTSDVRPYVLCVGDIFTDVFIKLLENEARIDTDADGSKRLSIPFGSKPPYERVDTVTSVGPSPNAGISCARLGLRVGMMSWLGMDKVADDSISYLAGERVDVAPIVRQPNTPSNTYYVLRYGADRTILVKNEAYDYRWVEPATKPDWIYLSLISADSWRLHEDMLSYLEAHPEVKLAFQPGTFHFKWGIDKLKRVYQRSYIVVMNREEAVDVTGGSYDDVRGLANALHAAGPGVVVITDGPEGSYASYDGRLYKVPNYPDPAPPLDRTGAGDAFASTIVAALALGETVATALTWAPINSMSVVQKLGAQAGLLGVEDIQKYLSEAPEWYKTEELHV